MDRESEPIYLLDMAAWEPKDAISEDFERGKWTAVPRGRNAAEGIDGDDGRPPDFGDARHVRAVRHQRTNLPLPYHRLTDEQMEYLADRLKRLQLL